MLSKIKKSLRISNIALDDEIQDLIDAAKADLKLAGVVNIDETDPLIIRAVTTYVKANFGYDNPDSIKLQQSYEMLRNHLSMSVEYNTEAVAPNVIS